MMAASNEDLSFTDKGQNDFNAIFENEQYTEQQKSKFEFYNSSRLRICEFDKALTFVDDYNTELSLMDLLDCCGFNSKESGYKFIYYLLCRAVNTMYVPDATREYYEQCATRYGVVPKNVDNAIYYSIRTAIKSRKFQRLNEIFRCDYFSSYCNNSDFLNFITRRLVLMKKYEVKITFKG